MTQWRDIPGYEGKYQISDDGQVKSLARLCNNRPVGERIRLLGTNRDGYKFITLIDLDGRRRRRQVHRLVAEAFLGPKPTPQHHVCHNDGSRSNNYAANLRWGTRSENMRDKRRHGTDHNTIKTHCKWGHEFTTENTYLAERGEGLSPRRGCRSCRTRQKRESDRRRAA